MILNTRYTKKEFEKLLTEKLFNEFAIDIASATDEQIYRALALIARGMLSEKRKRFIARTYGANGKQVYYLCMEFLMGRSLKTSLLNLGLCGVADEVLRDYSMKLDNIYEQEPDAGLGNGGLGRLAACYLDGMAPTIPPARAIPSCTNTASSSRRSWTAGSRNAPTTGCPAAACG